MKDIFERVYEKTSGSNISLSRSDMIEMFYARGFSLSEEQKDKDSGSTLFIFVKGDNTIEVRMFPPEEDYGE